MIGSNAQFLFFVRPDTSFFACLLSWLAAMGDMIVAKLLNQSLNFVDEALFHLVTSDILL